MQVILCEQPSSQVDRAGHIADLQVCKADSCQDGGHSPQQNGLLGNVKWRDSCARHSQDQLHESRFLSGLIRKIQLFYLWVQLYAEDNAMRARGQKD